MTTQRNPLERALVVALVVGWTACFIMAARNIVGGRSYPLIFVSGPADAAGHPVVTAFRGDPPLDADSPAVGDVILRVGQADLAGVGPVAFLGIFTEQAGSRLRVPAEVERGGIRRAVSLPAGSTHVFLPLLLVAPVFAGVALLLWLRARADPAARAFSLSFANLAFFLASGVMGSRLAAYVSFFLHLVTMTLTGPLGLRALLLFPHGRPLSAASRRWPWLFGVLGILHTAHFGWPVPPAVGLPAAALVVVVLLAVQLAVVTRAYQRADAIGRRQLRWVLFGTYCAAMPPMVAGLLAAASPSFQVLYWMSLSAIACIPLSILISILRFNLFDIDRIISATASYNVLLTAAITLGAAIVPPTARASAELFGVEPWLGQVGLSLPLAVAVVLCHQRLRPHIDRLFFADRWALDVGMHALLTDLSNVSEPRELLGRMVDGLTRLVHPETCAVYARRDESFLSCVAEGHTVPPALALDGPLIATLKARREPIVLDRAGRPPGVAVDPFERAVLETLGAAVVVPIWRQQALFLVLCLGRKRSGDVYTPTDVRLLAMLGDKVCSELERFEQAATLQQSRSMQDALRRYVPGAVATAIESGDVLEPSEREITVLFVDLRGYTTLCEPLGPHEIFATVNRYTETVSTAIRQHGGTVVEFHGDGLMAMFGVPAELKQKEAAAVRAARQVVAALATESAPGTAPLTVGVGIATGPAFVGNIRSADRLIWTAVGNTVNLAARLQQLTREMTALIAVDPPTHAAAGSAVADFRACSAVLIRGRQAPTDLYVLPLDDQAAA